MGEWKKDFGEWNGPFIKASEFDGEGKTVTFRSYKKQEHDDPEFHISKSESKVALDKKGNKVLDSEGKPLPNKFYDPKFPNGYQVLFDFEEGTFTCSSIPFLKVISRIEPKEGDEILIKRIGSGPETRYEMKLIKTVA